MTGQSGPESGDELGPESLLDPDLEPEAQRRLDDLVAGFEEDMRHRPTPMELGEEEGAGKHRAKRKRPVIPDMTPAAAAPDVSAETSVGEAEAPGGVAETPALPFDGAPPTEAPAEAAPVAAAPESAPAAAASDGSLEAATSEPAAGLPFGDIETWWAGGERVSLEVPTAGETVSREIFVRISGAGPWLTLVHGFPTSSYDWAPMVDVLSKKYRLLMFDLLGFGESDKPSGHDWSAFEQADIIEALWRRYEISSTRILAHDVGDTVTLELLARRQEGKLATGLEHVTFLNGGIYTGFHRPRPIQVWLQRPVIGGLIARMLSEARFGPALAEIFGPEHQPSAEELHQHWLSVARRDGGRSYHRLIKYIPERRAQAPRWEGALEAADLPMKFVWGMDDPVSGAHMAGVIRDRRPGANIVELAGVGHYPQLEAPAEVAAAVLP
ncbi:MAG TPA: alpha/beta hydrolase [Candidatus Dormibacteraeota bacterium]|nr:alpha/beta hydrolase [Candidatus Dormibacteraeota bacterium]